MTTGSDWTAARTKSTGAVWWSAMGILLICSGVVLGQMPIQQAWEQLPHYDYGQDMAALLSIDRAVIEAMQTPQSRSACAARLAALLQAPDTTPAARQYIAWQLARTGTDAEVPILAPMLTQGTTSDAARYALERIPGDRASQALRDALTELHGRHLVGLINTVGKRRDAQSVDELAALTDAGDAAVRAAAIRALGNVADVRSFEVLSARAARSPDPLPQDLAASLLRCAAALDLPAHRDAIRALYTRMSKEGQLAPIRRAALESLLTLQQGDAAATISDWLRSSDEHKRRVAAARLDLLSNAQLDSLSEDLSSLSTFGVVALIDVMAHRDTSSLLPKILELAASENQELKLAGLRHLGAVGGERAIALLTAELRADGPSAEQAKRSLQQLPREAVGAALIESLQDAAVRHGAIDVLKRIRYYEAIDPLISLASSSDPVVYEAAMEGLRGIADPDQHDLPRLVRLVLASEPGAQRDEAEKTILVVCGRLTDDVDRAKVLLETVNDLNSSDQVALLPLLGRLGGPTARQVIDRSLQGAGEEEEAAVRGLCNWPDASVAERLMQILTQDEEKRFRRWALRAYVRVVSLPSKRPDSDTLAMLQNAMQHAEVAADQRLVIERAATVRTMEAVNWIAGFLGQSELAQAACLALVELAHHRELRHPNLEQFGPLLQRVARISDNPAVIERAQRYRLGL